MYSVSLFWMLVLGGYGLYKLSVEIGSKGTRVGIHARYDDDCNIPLKCIHYLVDEYMPTITDRIQLWLL